MIGASIFADMTCVKYEVSTARLSDAEPANLPSEDWHIAASFRETNGQVPSEDGRHFLAAECNSTRTYDEMRAGSVPAD